MTDTSQGDTSIGDRKAYSQTILVYLLFALHVLFGITALIGVIVCHMKREVTNDTIFASHTTWQIWTFWTGAIGYAAGVYYLWKLGTFTILLVTLIWVFYRVGKGWWYALKNQPIGPGAYP